MWPVQNVYKSAKRQTENEVKTLSLVARTLYVITNFTNK